MKTYDQSDVVEATLRHVWDESMHGWNHEELNPPIRIDLAITEHVFSSDSPEKDIHSAYFRFQSGVRTFGDRLYTGVAITTFYACAGTEEETEISLVEQGPTIYHMAREICGSEEDVMSKLPRWLQSPTLAMVQLDAALSATLDSARQRHSSEIRQLMQL